MTERYLAAPGVLGAPLARTDSGGNSAWYLTDHLGSVHDVVNSSGSVVDHLGYDSYGNIVAETSASSGDRFKYAGMIWDAAISQYLAEHRPDNPLIGRFDGQDPKGFAGSSVNLYIYAGNAPTDATDPSGLQPPPGTTPFPGQVSLPQPPPGTQWVRTTVMVKTQVIVKVHYDGYIDTSTGAFTPGPHTVERIEERWVPQQMFVLQSIAASNLMEMRIPYNLQQLNNPMYHRPFGITPFISTGLPIIGPTAPTSVYNPPPEGAYHPELGPENWVGVEMGGSFGRGGGRRGGLFGGGRGGGLFGGGFR